MATPRTDAMLAALRAERVDTWFDLGLMLDRLREERRAPALEASPSFEAFTRELAHGVGIVTFEIGIDGVSMEVAKYADTLESLVPDVPIHYIAGRFDPASDHVIEPGAEWHCIPEIDAFESWPLYRDFFGRRLERGGPHYNALIGKFWDATLLLCEALGRTVESRDLRLLFLVNVNSNPGNVALALAAALLSEHLGIPVINNCHDFYWEGGRSEAERAAKELPRGPRDHFFTNAHLGEVFSVVELLYPWESRSWVHLCINRVQVDSLRSRYGCNPAAVSEIGTAIDTSRYRALDRARIKATWRQLCELLQPTSAGDASGKTARVSVRAARDVLSKTLDGKAKAGAQLASKKTGLQPMLIGIEPQRQVDFASNNTVLLQPTRILRRKRIEANLKMIQRLFGNEQLAEIFRRDPTRKLTLLVTGPIASGHEKTAERIVSDFARIVKGLDAAYRDRVYLCLLLSGFDDSEFRARQERPIGMPELYNLASLVVLPSETEGRGLPIIEAAACETPVLTRRYEPAAVFHEVIGTKLDVRDRFEVHIFEDNQFSRPIIEHVVGCMLEPGHCADSIAHNRRVVERRFSMGAMARDLEDALRRLHLQLTETGRFEARAREAVAAFEQRVGEKSADLESLLRTEHREYLPGTARMGLMSMLKSLIDPSYFRVEEQRLRGIAFEYAHRLEVERSRTEPASLAEKIEFYASVEALFLAPTGEMTIRIDHSLAYRHRNRRRYAYRELTPQELSGVIALIHRDMHDRVPSSAPVVGYGHQLKSWPRMIERCTGGEPALDDRDVLLERLSQNVPLAIFLGPLVEHELEVFVLHAFRRRLGLSVHDEITEAELDAKPDLATITLFARRDPAPDALDAAALTQHLIETDEPDLRRLAGRKLCRVVVTEQVSIGIDLRQLGDEAVSALIEIRDAGGALVAACDQAATTTDGAAIERFHIGRDADPFTASLLGIPEGRGYVSRVPAGLRATLAYPTPVQTAASLSATLRGSRYRRACKRLGEPAVLEALREDAYARGSKVEDVLSRLAASGRTRAPHVEHEALNGLYPDGSPWSGAIARVARPLRYAVVTTKGKNRTVPEFVRRFDRPRRRPRIAWNGGYILNAELVGKLGLPETFIGSPLGLIVSGGKVVSAPLFEKPALLVGHDRSLEIRRVSCAEGIRARGPRTAIDFGPEARNCAKPGDAPCFYDLLYGEEALPGDGRVLVQLVGNRIMQIRETGAGETAPVLPVGLALSFPKDALPSDWREGTPLALEVAGLDGVAEAVEAGPLLLQDGEVAIDMEREGWTTRASIRTQAARLDFLDMRGPKIAVGLDADGALTVLAVNGRIRESTGATHLEMAEILRSRGVRVAMGFDPGGSATLVVGKQVLNISPYNPSYEQNVYALPPEPRGVANAVIGY